MALSASSAGHGQHHANAHVEGVEHVALAGCRPRAAITSKMGRHADVGLGSMRGGAALRQAAGDVLVEAAAGDVADTPLTVHLRPCTASTGLT